MASMQGARWFCRQLKRRYVLTFFQTLPQCRVGIEECASSHYCRANLRLSSHRDLMPPKAAMM